jgi:hypothetical protein
MAARKAIEIAKKAVDFLPAEGTAVHTLQSNSENVSMAHVSTVELDPNCAKDNFDKAKELLAEIDPCHTDLGSKDSNSHSRQLVLSFRAR